MLDEHSEIRPPKIDQNEQIGGRKPARRGALWRWDALRAFLWYLRGESPRRVRWCPLLGLRAAPKLYLHELRGQLDEAALLRNDDAMAAALTDVCRDQCGDACDMTVDEIKRESAAWNRTRDEFLRGRRRLRAEEKHGRRT